MKKYLLMCIVILFATLFYGNLLLAKDINIQHVRCDTDYHRIVDFVQLSNGGGAFGVGIIKDSSSTDPDTLEHWNARLIKYDANWNTIWEKSFGGNKADQFSLIRYIGGNRLLIGGQTVSTDGDVSYGWNCGVGNIWLCIIDTNGNFLHGLTWGCGSTTELLDMDIAKDGSIYCTGQTYAENGDFASNTGPSLVSNTYLGRADSLLNKKWMKVLAGDQSDAAFSMAINQSDQVILSGYGLSNNGDYAGCTGAGRQVIICIDSSQNIIWKRRYGDPNSNSPTFPLRTIIDSVNGDIYCISSIDTKGGDCADTNYSYLNEYGSRYSWIMRLDSVGNKIWSRIYGGFVPNITDPRPSVSASGAFLLDTHLWVLNTVYRDYGDNHDLGNDTGGIWLLRLDSNGNIINKLRCLNKYVNDGFSEKLKRVSGFDIGYMLIQTGTAPQYTNALDCKKKDMNVDLNESSLIYRLNLWPTGIPEIIEQEEQVFIYPNPADDKITVAFEENENRSIEVYTTEGKRIYISKQKRKTCEIDTHSWASGTYIVLVKSDKNKTTKKIIIQ